MDRHLAQINAPGHISKGWGRDKTWLLSWLNLCSWLLCSTIFHKKWAERDLSSPFRVMAWKQNSLPLSPSFSLNPAGNFPGCGWWRSLGEAEKSFSFSWRSHFTFICFSWLAFLSDEQPCRALVAQASILISQVRARMLMQGLAGL